MAIHILGNGPSITLFDRNESCSDSDVIVGCNFSDVALRPDYTVLIDVRAVKQFMSKDNPYVLEIDAVISTRAYNYLERHFGWDKVPDSVINVIDTIDLVRDRKISKNLAMNSGQHAAIYSLRKNKDQKEIHIWGTDSFWSQDIQSSTDPIARPRHKGPRIRPHITRSWNRYWTKIFNDFPRKEFIIHCTSGSTVNQQIRTCNNATIVSH